MQKTEMGLINVGALSSKEALGYITSQKGILYDKEIVDMLVY